MALIINKSDPFNLYSCDCSRNAGEILNKKINFLTELVKKVGEQKIDVVIKGKNSKDKDIFNIAKKTGVMI